MSAFPRLAQVGLAARGLVYVVLGALVLQVAGGDRSGDASATGAIRAVGRTGAGTALLVLRTAGFLAYSAWRLALAATGDDLSERARDGASGLVYIGFSWLAISLVLGRNGGDGNAEEGWTARVLAVSGGRWLVAGAGLALAGLGVYWVRKAFRRDYRPPLHADTPQVVVALGSAGYGARAAAAAAVAWFLVQAAVQFDPTEAEGLDGALSRVAASSWGPAALVVVAACFVAFGVFSWCQARWADLDV